MEFPVSIDVASKSFSQYIDQSTEFFIKSPECSEAESEIVAQVLPPKIKSRATASSKITSKKNPQPFNTSYPEGSTTGNLQASAVWKCLGDKSGGFCGESPTLIVKMDFFFSPDHISSPIPSDIAHHTSFPCFHLNFTRHPKGVSYLTFRHSENSETRIGMGHCHCSQYIKIREKRWSICVPQAAKRLVTEPLCGPSSW